MIMTKLRTSCSGKSYICMYLWQYSCVFQLSVLGYWKQLGMSLRIIQVQLMIPGACATQKLQDVVMYNRVQNSCNRHSRWWKPQLRKGITTCCLLQDFCKVIQARTPTDLQLCSCRLYVACHCYGQLTHIQLSHTVPQTLLLMHTSTLPSYWEVPPTSRTSP